MIYAGIWIVLAAAHILVLVFAYKLEPLPAVVEGLLFNFSFALLGIGLWYMVRYSDLNRRSWLELLFVHLTGVTVVQLIWIVPVYHLLKLIFAGNLVYVGFLEETLTIRVITGTVLYAAIVSIAYLVDNIRRLRDQQKREDELKNLLKDSELSMLRFQINPHFLFNSLNAVSSLIIKRPEEANQMVLKLSGFMRYSLESAGKAMSTAGKELEHCNLYLDIERVRFGERLKVKMKTEESLNDYPVPAMLLQPLVENAIKHGLNDAEEGILVHVTLENTSNGLKIIVTNPAGIKSKRYAVGTGTGLKNIRSRLENLYARSDLMRIREENGLFIVTINIPPDVRKGEKSYH